MHGQETFDEVIRRQGTRRRSFAKFCTSTAASMGLSRAHATTIARALETRPRVPVLWPHGLECTCCSDDVFLDQDPFHERLANADRIGLAATGAVTAGLAVRRAASAVKRLIHKPGDVAEDKNLETLDGGPR